MANKRKLASIQYVHDVTPIEGADKIECVHVLGWQVVCQKDQFHVGDWCVYFEVDSFLPIDERFEFLRSSSYKKTDLMGEGFRLKTIRLRGQISQGLIMPLSILPIGKYSLGDDVTDILGVKKWEVEEYTSAVGTVIGEFPSHLFHKTDELRVQSYPELINEFKKAGEYYITTKMDGSSVTMYNSEGHDGICSRNNELADDDKCAMWKFAHEHKVFEKMKELGLCNIAIQGEWCGPGIQKNRLALKRPDWYVFTIIDIESGKRFSMDMMQKICNELGVKTVPCEEVKTEFEYQTIDELLERAKGKYPSGQQKEGIVIRPIANNVWSDTINGWLSMKVLNNDYLVKEK